MPYGTGNCTYCARIAKVAFFFNLFIIYTIYHKKIAQFYRKKMYFIIIYTTYRKKNFHTFTAKKKIIRIDDFFVHKLHFSSYPSTSPTLSMERATRGLDEVGDDWRPSRDGGRLCMGGH